MCLWFWQTADGGSSLALTLCQRLLHTLKFVFAFGDKFVSVWLNISQWDVSCDRVCGKCLKRILWMSWGQAVCVVVRNHHHPFLTFNPLRTVSHHASLQPVSSGRVEPVAVASQPRPSAAATRTKSSLEEAFGGRQTEMDGERAEIHSETLIKSKSLIWSSMKYITKVMWI